MGKKFLVKMKCRIVKNMAKLMLKVSGREKTVEKLKKGGFDKLARWIEDKYD